MFSIESIMDGPHNDLYTTFIISVTMSRCTTNSPVFSVLGVVVVLIR